MHDVWVYAQSKTTVSELSTALAELGFSPHYLGTGQPLMPSGHDGPPRRPSLAAVVAGPGEPLPSDLFDRISDAEELDDVGLLLVVEPEHLRSRSKNTPFDQARLQGRALLTLVAGKTVYNYADQHGS